MIHFWLDIDIISERLVIRFMEGGLCDLLLFVWVSVRTPLLNSFGAMERLAFMWGPCCRAKIRMLVPNLVG